METDFVARLIARIPSDPRLEVPPGDDAAVLRPPALKRTVVTVDMLMEGTDFILGPECSARSVGHKSLAVSLSDLAAMGARPEAAFTAVALPRRGGDALGRDLEEGLMALAAEHGVAVAGGDTNTWDGPLVVSTTAIGSVAPGRAWRRDGARPGDLLVATGAFGGSLLGRHLHVVPRVREALHVADHFEVHAAIDCSDGLTLDLARMMAASNARGVVRLAAVPVHADAVRLAGRDGSSPLDHALGDGEDFELLLAMPAAEAQRLVAAAGTPPLDLRITIIGAVVEGVGLLAEATDGSLSALEPRGYVHAFDT